MLKTLSRNIPRLYHTDLMQYNRLQYVSSYNITSLICERINAEIEDRRKQQQFEHIVEQKRDWMSY